VNIILLSDVTESRICYDRSMFGTELKNALIIMIKLFFFKELGFNLQVQHSW